MKTVQSVKLKGLRIVKKKSDITADLLYAGSGWEHGL